MLAQCEAEVGASWPHEAMVGALFRVAPIDADNAFRESLTSLMVRIARAHAVSPRDLVMRVLGAYSKEIAAMCNATFFRHYSAPINGLGKYASLFSSMIGGMACLPDADCLTLLPLQGLLASQGSPVIHPRQRWCVECLRNMVRSGEEPHRPLLWSLAAIDICPLHRRALTETCPRCHGAQPIIPHWPDILYCDTCRSSLLSVDAAVAEPTTVGATDLSAWNLVACVDLLDGLHKINRTALHCDFQRFVNTTVISSAAGNRAGLCREIGLPPFALSKWFNGKDKPSMPALLRFLFALDIYPSEVFFPTNDARKECTAVIRKLNLPGRENHPRDEEQAAALFDAALASDFSPSLTELAIKLGLTRSGLKYRYPDLCRQVASRRRVYISERARRHQMEGMVLIVEFSRKCLREGVFPNKDRVETELRKNGLSLLRPGLRQAYHQVVVDILGGTMRSVDDIKSTREPGSSS